MTMWNRLPFGIEVDLTREQFTRGEVVGEPSVRAKTADIRSPTHSRYHRYEKYLVLSQRVQSRLRARSLHQRNAP